MPFCSAFATRARFELLVVDQARRFLLGEQARRLADLHSAQPPATAAEAREHALDLRGELLHARRREDLHLRLARRDLDVDLALVELALAQLLAEASAGRRRFLARLETDQDIEDALLGGVLRARAHPAHLLLARLLDAISTRSLMMVSTSRPT